MVAATATASHLPAWSERRRRGGEGGGCSCSSAVAQHPLCPTDTQLTPAHQRGGGAGALRDAQLHRPHGNRDESCRRQLEGGGGAQNNGGRGRRLFAVHSDWGRQGKTRRKRGQLGGGKCAGATRGQAAGEARTAWSDTTAAAQPPHPPRVQLTRECAGGGRGRQHHADSRLAHRAADVARQQRAGGAGGGAGDKEG